MKNNKRLFTIASIFLTIPSLIYLIKNKTVYGLRAQFSFFLDEPKTYIETTIGALCFGTILVLLFYAYFKIIKNNNKVFKNTKEIIIYVFIISMIFAFVLPFTSSDIFYYIETGWIDAKYNKNPYNDTIYDTSLENPQDEILLQNCRGMGKTNSSIWTIICSNMQNFKLS